MGSPLTVLIPCKNEANNIAACIESVRELAAEILVADSGSTDATLEVVQTLGGCRLIEREFVNYADFKNWAIPQASHPWVLIVDADERITPALAEEIRRVLVDSPGNIDGYFVPRQMFFMGHPIRYSGWQNDRLLRLLRRDRCRYAPCRVHEEIDIDPQRTRRLQNKLLHYSYWTYDQFLEKHIAQTRWGAEDRWDNGYRANFRQLTLRPMLRFFFLYLVRGGFLDGLPGLQICTLMAFFESFMKQARLWEKEHALPRPECPIASSVAGQPVLRLAPPGAQARSRTA